MKRPLLTPAVATAGAFGLLPLPATLIRTHRWKRREASASGSTFEMGGTANPRQELEHPPHWCDGLRIPDRRKYPMVLESAPTWPSVPSTKRSATTWISARQRARLAFPDHYEVFALVT